MAKKRKKLSEPARYVPAEDLARKSISKGLIMLGQTVELQRLQLDTIINMNGTRAISGKEEQYLWEARDSLQRVEKICRVIGERNASS